MGFETVCIVQPYVAEYRLPFYERLRESLRRDGLLLRIISARPSGPQAMREDARELVDQVVVNERSISIGARGTLRYKHVWRQVRQSRLTIVQLSSGALESSLLCALRPHTTAVWGHGPGWITERMRLDSFIEYWMMRRACHTFVYTSDGEVEASRAGVPSSKITVVRNTIDLEALVGAMEHLSVSEARQILGIGAWLPSKTCAFIGGLDGSKRLRILLDAGDEIARREPEFRLLIAGSGVEEPEVRRHATRAEWLHFVGRADVTVKAAIGRVSSLLLNPGRVGLIAVDSFALGLPIITMEWSGHAPEFAYLEDGVTAVVLPDCDSASFAKSVLQLLDDSERVKHLSDACRSQRTFYSIDTMVANFHHGILTSIG